MSKCTLSVNFLKFLVMVFSRNVVVTILYSDVWWRTISIDLTVFCCLLMISDIALFIFFDFKGHLLILVFIYLDLSPCITSSSLNDSACHSASLVFFINDTSTCSSATGTFPWMTFFLAGNFHDLKLEAEFDFEDLDPKDFEVFPEDFDFLSKLTNFSPSFNQLWIL